MSRSSTDDVEVVMCPASGSPGYYCNSDVCLNNVDSLHWLHLGFVVTMIVMSFLNYLPSQSTVFVCSSQWTGGCLCLHGLDFWKQKDWKTGGSFQGKNVSINFKVSLSNFLVLQIFLVLDYTFLQFLCLESCIFGLVFLLNI